MPDTIGGQLVVGFNPVVLRGNDGRSITNATVNGSGHLIVTFSDGNTVDAGALTGVTTVDGVAGVVSLTGSYAPVFQPTASYTYNVDGTVATATEAGVTTTFTYNGDGTIH